MKIIKPFLCFLISLFMVFDLFVLQISAFTHDKLFNNNYYIARFQTLGLYSFVTDSVVKDLGPIQRECNLPQNIFDSIFSKDNVESKIDKYISDTINYMAYKTSDLPKSDISSYSDEINKRIDNFIISSKVELDASSKSDIDTIKNQTSNIVKNDVYLVSFDKLASSPSFQKPRIYLYKIYSLEYLFIGIFIIFALLLLILEIKNLFRFFIWFSSSLIAGGLLVLIPSAFLLNTKFMDRLALSSPKLLLIAGTIIRDFLQTIMNLSIYITAAGLIIFIANIIIDKIIVSKKSIRA